MKLTVRIVASPSVPGKKVLALCTEDGEVLPMQISSKVETETAEIGVIHVSFYIDGDKVRFADNDAR